MGWRMRCLAMCRMGSEGVAAHAHVAPSRRVGYDAVRMIRSRLNRFGWIFAALLQLLVPTFATVADARIESESRGAHAHVEAHGAPTCPRAHEADCILCRVVAAGAAPARQVAPTSIAAVVNELPARREISCTPTRLAGDPPQRAPPV
jgi:hypothetical protein